MFEQALEHGKLGRNFWWVGSVYHTAEIAYLRLKNGLPNHLYSANDSKLQLTLPNGALLAFRSAEKADHLFGEDVYAAVGDEVSRWKEPAFSALRSTVTATGGSLRLLYNTKGRGTWSWILSRKIAQGSLPNSRHVVFDVYVAVRAGLIPESEVEAARATLPLQVFNELYLCIPSDDGGNPFGLSAIADQIAPLSTADPIVYGVDLAKSYDWTVVTGLDLAGAVCRYDRWQGPWQDTLRKIIALCGTVPTLVDSTGVGDPILEGLQADGRYTFEGFKFTPSSKQQLMEGLAVAIQQHEITYPSQDLLPGCQIVPELESFEYEYTRTGVRYSAPPGMHDDCVASLGLAVAHRRVHKTDGLPYGWLRNDPVFRQSVLQEIPPRAEAAEEAALRRQNELEAALARMEAV